MSLTTKSQFFYGYTVTEDNKYLSFREGVTDFIAELNLGSYSLTDFVEEIERALNATGDYTYTCSVARSTRYITIAATSAFDLLVGTGAVGNIFSLAGFTGSDRTGLTTYTGNAASGSSFRPQFVLQSFVDKNANQNAIESTVMTSASGLVEVVKFGNSKFFEFNIKYSTNLTTDNSVIENSATGYTDLISFMEYAITKAPFEIMPNRDAPDTYDQVILDRTDASEKGVGFKLKEMYDKGLPGFYETGVMKLRVLT